MLVSGLHPSQQQDIQTHGQVERERGGGRGGRTETDTVTSSGQDWKMEVSLSQANSIELRKLPAGALERLGLPRDREGWESKHQDGVLPPQQQTWMGHPCFCRVWSKQGPSVSLTARGRHLRNAMSSVFLQGVPDERCLLGGKEHTTLPSCAP